MNLSGLVVEVWHVKFDLIVWLACIRTDFIADRSRGKTTLIDCDLEGFSCYLGNQRSDSFLSDNYDVHAAILIYIFDLKFCSDDISLCLQ
jgi:hypothetical protein